MMVVSLVSVRILFFALSIGVAMSVAVQQLDGGSSFFNMVLGLFSGIALGGGLMGLDQFCKRIHLKAFNTAVIGLFCGYLMAQAILWCFEGITGSSLSGPLFLPIRFFVYLVSAYLGIVMAIRSSNQFHCAIPFVEFQVLEQKKKEILLDTSALQDPRVLDLALFGLLDELLVYPRFLLAEMCAQMDAGDEATKQRARRGLDVLKKLEALPHLRLRYTDLDYPEQKDSSSKMVQCARQMGAAILVGEMQRFQKAHVDEVHFLNLQQLSQVQKVSMQAGDTLSIQIQHHGKGPRQGVGYLEDGAMVVVNGGADFIGETIKTRVISIKQTMAGMGRMIFCNALEENGGFLDHRFTPPSPVETESGKKTICTF